MTTTDPRMKCMWCNFRSHSFIQMMNHMQNSHQKDIKKLEDRYGKINKN